MIDGTTAPRIPRLSFAEFETLAEMAGCTAYVMRDGSWSIYGPLTVRFWPNVNVIRVKGTVADQRVRGPFDAVTAAVIGPPYAFTRMQRGKSGSVRKEVWARGDRRCRWCGLQFECPERATVEHVIPLSRGGKRRGPNATLACSKCNTERGSGMPELFGWIPSRLRKEVA